MNELMSVCRHCNMRPSTTTCPYCNQPICSTCLATANTNKFCSNSL